MYLCEERVVARGQPPGVLSLLPCESQEANLAIRFFTCFIILLTLKNIFERIKGHSRKKNGTQPEGSKGQHQNNFNNYFTTLKSTIFKISIRLYFLEKNEFTEKDNSNIILIKVQTVCIS